MTPLRQRMIEDMQLRNRTPRTQRSYVHYVAEYARYFNVSPEKLDAEAIRQYLLYALNERKLSPESVNTCVSVFEPPSDLGLVQSPVEKPPADVAPKHRNLASHLWDCPYFI